MQITKSRTQRRSRYHNRFELKRVAAKLRRETDLDITASFLAGYRQELWGDNRPARPWHRFVWR